MRAEGGGGGGSEAICGVCDGDGEQLEFDILLMQDELYACFLSGGLRAVPGSERTRPLRKDAGAV